MDLKGFLQQSRVAMSMILVQLFTTGMMILSKIVFAQGAFVFALLTYRQIVAAATLAPFAFFMERNTEMKLTWAAVFWIFISALLGLTMTGGLYFYGLKITSATFASNFLNLVPITTFILSTVFGVEKLGLRSKAGRMKIAGTILCVGGAIFISSYKGKLLHIWPSKAHSHQVYVRPMTPSRRAHGSLLLTGSCLSSATWFLVQVKLFKNYPSMYRATMLTCLVGCTQAAVVGVLFDRRKVAWKLRWDLQLVTIFYSGVLMTGANYCLMTWAIARQGPTYPSMFNPLSLIFVAVLETVFLGEEISIGRILGMVMIIAGLYAFLWGKSNELQHQDRNTRPTVLVREPTQLNSIDRYATPSNTDHK